VNAFVKVIFDSDIENYILRSRGEFKKYFFSFFMALHVTDLDFS
jgi:hypothetical protein